MQTINPFSDPEFKKSILKGEGIDIEETQAETIEYEILGEGEEENGFNEIISSAPVIPHSKEIKNIILDASQIAKNEKEERAIELNKNLNKVLSEYNKEYGMSLSLDLNNLSASLVACADPKSRRTLELYLSEIFQSIRPILILQMIGKLTMTIEYLLDPQRLLDENDLTTADKFVIVEKLMDYISRLEDMKDSIVVKGSDLELKKLRDEEGGERDMTEEEKKTVDQFMAMFKKDSGV